MSNSLTEYLQKYQMKSNSDMLFKAVKKSDKEIVAQILQDPSININELDHKSGKSVVQISMENSDEDIFKMLIRVEGFDVNRINRNGESYLEVAIMMNNVGFLAKILERKVNPKLKNAEGESILQVAIKNSVQRQIIHKLIHYGYDVNQKIPVHGSLLNLAISANQIDNFLCLLEEQNISLKTLDDDENTCLIWAVKMNKPQLVQAILIKLKEIPMSELEKQFFINHQDLQGNTALHIAYLKDLEIIKNLLEKEGKVFGLDISIKNKEGKTCEIIQQQRQKQKILHKEKQSLLKQEKILKKKEREEQKIRQRKEEQTLKMIEKKKKKQDEKQLQDLMIRERETEKTKMLWITGIGFIAVLGMMYLLILNSIEKKPNAF